MTALLEANSVFGQERLTVNRDPVDCDFSFHTNEEWVHLGMNYYLELILKYLA